MEGDGFPIDTSVMNIHLMTFKYSANSGILFLSFFTFILIYLNSFFDYIYIINFNKEFICCIILYQYDFFHIFIII